MISYSILNREICKNGSHFAIRNPLIRLLDVKNIVQALLIVAILIKKSVYTVGFFVRIIPMVLLFRTMNKIRITIEATEAQKYLAQNTLSD